MTLLAAVADTLVPAVRIEDDGTPRTALAPVARAAHAPSPGVEFATWSRAELESLLGELLAEPDAAVAVPACDCSPHVTNAGATQC